VNSEGSFVQARQAVEGKDHSLRDKRASLSEAASLLEAGDHVAVGGCLYSRTPMALLRELLRRDPRGLTLSRNLMCYEGDLFMAAGAVDTVLTSWMGIGLPWGVSRALRHYVESGFGNGATWQSAWATGRGRWGSPSCPP
jgi:glutaconate CoA-transferase subunit A